FITPPRDDRLRVKLAYSPGVPTPSQGRGAPGWNGCETSFSARATNEKPRHQSGLLRGILR
ncbi:unnamed protein product, partial [Ectocarpus sp. 13 AM-2016]